jgi:hypothetical protein
MPVTFTISRLAGLVGAAVVLLLVLALAWQTIRIEGLKVWPISHKGLKAELADANDKLKAISSKRDEQGKTTSRTITETKIIYRDAEKVAERIEKAPTALDCKTPGEIMGADL